MGILINFNPLLVRLETKAARSPITPPPKAIIQSDRLKFCFNNLSIILFANLKLFVFSFAVSLYILISYFFNELSNFFKILIGYLLSEIIHIFLTPVKLFCIKLPVLFKILFPK